MGNEVSQQLVMYRQILEGLSTAVLLFNQELKLLYINPTGEMLFEASAKRLRLMTLDELIISDSSLNDRIRHAFVTDHPVTEREVNLTLPNLRSIIVDCAITPLTDTPSNRYLLVELEQMDRSLRISREENQLAQNDAIRALVRGLAHEVKNPLGGIRGAAQLLERELDNESLKEYTSVIIEEADRLRNLVNRLLGPNALPNKELINIHQVLEHVRQLVNVEMRGDITFVTDYDPSIPDILGDRDQLIQAVLNIVGNAVQAIGTRGEIILRTRTQRQFTIGQTCHKLVCRVEIIDNGPGIPEEMMESIFYPMVTGRAEGTGLGLSIAQTLISQHGGLIQCESRPGRTRFALYLPLDYIDTHTENPQSPSRESA